jgi:hypothetical protein
MFNIYKTIEKIEEPKFAKAIYLKDAIW